MDPDTRDAVKRIGLLLVALTLSGYDPLPHAIDPIAGEVHGK